MLRQLDPIKLFQDTVKRVPAYNRLIKSLGLNHKKIRTLADFSKVPIIDKYNYINKYSLLDLFPNKRLPSLAYASSGSSGRPSKWFRGKTQDEVGGRLHADLLEKVFEIKKN